MENRTIVPHPLADGVQHDRVDLFLGADLVNFGASIGLICHRGRHPPIPICSLARD
jgi:hypothetical protein